MFKTYVHNILQMYTMTRDLYSNQVAALVMIGAAIFPLCAIFAIPAIGQSVSLKSGYHGGSVKGVYHGGRIRGVIMEVQ